MLRREDVQVAEVQEQSPGGAGVCGLQSLGSAEPPVLVLTAAASSPPGTPRLVALLQHK